MLVNKYFKLVEFVKEIYICLICLNLNF